MKTKLAMMMCIASMAVSRRALAHYYLAGTWGIGTATR